MKRYFDVGTPALLIVVFATIFCFRFNTSHVRLKTIEPLVVDTTGITNEANITIIPSAQIELVPTSFSLRLLTPSDFILTDALYCLFFIGICIFFILDILSPAPSTPFTRRRVLLFFSAAIFALLFFALNSWRYIWFDNYITEHTHTAYGYIRGLFPVELVFFVIVLRLAFFFNHWWLRQTRNG